MQAAVPSIGFEGVKAANDITLPFCCCPHPTLLLAAELSAAGTAAALEAEAKRPKCRVGLPGRQAEASKERRIYRIAGCGGVSLTARLHDGAHSSTLKSREPHQPSGKQTPPGRWCQGPLESPERRN